MDTHSNPPALIDMSTGSEYQRWEIEGAMMTIETTQHPYRQLAGSSFVTLSENITVGVNDDLWERVVGLNFFLPGGCEVDVDDAELDRALEDIEECDENWPDAMERRPDLFCNTSGLPEFDGALERYAIASDGVDLLVPVIVNDADLPPVRCLVPLASLRARFQPIDRGTGSHARSAAGKKSNETICSHVGKNFGKTKCRGCLRRFWMMRAKELGVIDE